jgi:hypothetical protein
MFFRNLLCTVTLATLASAAVAKQIPTPYTSDQSDSTTEEVFEREAEPEPARTAVWEQAHGGPAPSYKYGEGHDASAWHIARDANPMPEAEPEPEAGWANVGGNRQPKPSKWAFPRNANPMAEAEPEPEPEPGWPNVGGNRQPKPGNWASHLSSGVQDAIPTIKPFLKGGPSKFEGKFNQAREADGPNSEDVDVHEEPEDLVARDANPKDLEVPDFGDQDVDTLLAGLLLPREAAGDQGSDQREPKEQFNGTKEDLSGYDAGILQSRSDGTADEIDYSLAGYEAETFESDEEEKTVRLIQARDLTEDELAGDDEYLHSDEHRNFLASHGVTKRSFKDDIQDAEHNRIDARDVKIPIPDFGGQDVDTSLDGMLGARDSDADKKKVPDFDGQNVDVSLEGYDDGPVVHARGAAGDEDEDEDEAGSDDEYYDADAAYANAEVVKEFFAADPELE